MIINLRISCFLGGKRNNNKKKNSMVKYLVSIVINRHCFDHLILIMMCKKKNIQIHLLSDQLLSDLNFE